MNYLQIALYYANSEMAPVFIPLIEDINNLDLYGQGVLHQAAYYAGADVIQLLLENGADKTIRDYDGLTAYDTYVKFHTTLDNKIVDLLKIE
jgi:ankyrin repeat protein